MKYFIFLVVIIMFGCKSSTKKSNSSSIIHFDGLYKSALQTNQATGDQSISYLRFYNDGTVIHVSTLGTPEQINNWFVKENENVSEGTYKLKQNIITFTYGGTNAAVENNGSVVNKELLQIHTKSLSNNNEKDVTYSFVEI